MPTLNTFPALPLPDFPEAIEPSYKTDESQFGDGYKLIAEDGINSRTDSVPLQWSNISTSEMTLIRTFLEAHAPAVPFYYTPIDGVQRTFTCKQWKMQRVDSGFFDMSATLEQYHGA